MQFQTYAHRQTHTPCKQTNWHTHTTQYSAPLVGVAVILLYLIHEFQLPLIERQLTPSQCSASSSYRCLQPYCRLCVPYNFVSFIITDHERCKLWKLETCSTNTSLQPTWHCFTEGWTTWKSWRNASNGMCTGYPTSNAQCSRLKINLQQRQLHAFHTCSSSYGMKLLPTKNLLSIN